MNYQKNDVVLVYNWVGTQLKRKVLFGSGVATGALRYLDNAIYAEIDLGDGLGNEWIHEDNLVLFSEWLEECRISNEAEVE